MAVRQFSAATLISLVLGYAGPSTLQHAAPGTLRPSGHELHLKGGITGYAWARRGTTLAVMLRGGGAGPIEIVDARTLTVRHSIPLHVADVCGLTFDGATLVALTSDHACYFEQGRLTIARIDIQGRRVVSKTPVAKSLRAIFPTNLAFGDGRAFVAERGGVEVIDLRTGKVTAHVPRRVLAKGENVVHARWLGGRLLGVGPTVVDIRTWRSRLLLTGAREVAAAGRYLVASGANGAGVYTRTGKLVRRILAHEDVTTTWTVGGVIYALVGSAMDVVDLATGQRLRVVPQSTPALLLAP